MKRKTYKTLKNSFSVFYRYLFGKTLKKKKKEKKHRIQRQTHLHVHTYDNNKNPYFIYYTSVNICIRCLYCIVLLLLCIGAVPCRPPAQANIEFRDDRTFSFLKRGCNILFPYCQYTLLFGQLSRGHATVMIIIFFTRYVHPYFLTRVGLRTFHTRFRSAPPPLHP